MDGDWSAEHPALQPAVEDELRALNDAVDERNASLAARHAAGVAEAQAYMQMVQG